ncbi:Actin cortical patch SUR7/pH-response regulator PalI [Penicillium macrosclerotiorum]|uniref:Actin cortical patch SUR7/pH-response regulator PalI n=1 Tax=Penicillium macrosclerotiorum TaxID=303699 RepID=UPI00254750C9|nr:Actin cortical patch SUR7/pH-response regulator PalI [Penicillium macrosclerotiorum]KAJ5693060.1 Actin cortical patch SUR7/pH-response regulator PalI [Penicillium macrosclerotiorum]
MLLSRASLGFLGLFFMASAILLIFLTLLGGARNSNPLNQIYFLQADTSNIPGAPSTSRWTFWNLCSVTNGKNDCGSSHPDFPFDPPSSRNFGTTENVPSEFIGTNHYFLTSRFMFPFIIIGLFFAVLSLFTGLLAMCTRIGSYISGFLSWLALTFQVITTCLMTAVFVQGRSAFSRNGQTSKLGVKAFAFMWTASACLFLSCLMYCLGGAVGRKESGYSGRKERRRGFFSSARSNSVRSQKKEESTNYA